MRMRLALPLALSLSLASCGDGGGGGTEPTPPTPGALTVSLTTPNTGDRAIIVQITGPEIAGVEAGTAGYVVHSRATAPGTVRAAVFGALGSGPLLRFQVPDVNGVAAYSASVVEVADASNALREIAGYTAAVAR
jgi:hypothetical protein